MYHKFYHLKQDPFGLTPDPAFLYMTEQHRDAYAGLFYSVCTAAGLTVLVGDAGTGKTTLLNTLVGMLEKRRFVVALCNNPTMTREEFYDLLLMKLGVECSSTLKSRQLAALQESLAWGRAIGKAAVLIVDEAQRLPLELLEEVRLLQNLETPQEKLLGIIMAGQPEFTEILRRPELRQFKQRIRFFCKLEPLKPAEVREYIQHRLTIAGNAQQDLFAEGSVNLVYEYTKGIPRLVNTLCDGALRIGLALQSPRITPAIIQEAAMDVDLSLTAETRASTNGTKPAAAAAPPVREPEAERAAVSVPAVTESNGRGGYAERMPLEDYATRQKSLHIFTGLLDRWRR